jgi:integrase
MKLTAKYVENVRPDPVRREIADGGCAGLYLLLQPSGFRSWAVRYRINGKSKKLTIGSWPAVSLLDARVAAAAARKRVKQGEDPAKAKADDKIKADAAKENTVTAVCEGYLAYERGRKDRLRTLDQRVSILKRLVYPALGSRPIGEVRRSDIVKLLDKIEAGAGPRMADVSLAVLRRIFHWHEVREDDFVSPIIRGLNRTNTKESARSRVLDDSELAAIWTAASAPEAQPFGALVRFLLLTTARRNEAARMRWDEVSSDGIWVLPASRSKTKVQVIRPLSKAARVLLAEQPRFDGCDYVFTANSRSPIASFSGPKEKLDAASGVRNWRVHDLRRTSRSLLSRAGIVADTAERCLGHAMPTIRAVYDRHSFVPEMAHAFEALSQLVSTIVNPLEGEVADMAAERSKRRR